jgi:hypothetical protein
MALIDPGKPSQNETAKSFNGKFRDECFAMEWCRHRVEAKVVMETWRRHYNEVRPHSSLKNLTPFRSWITVRPDRRLTKAVFQIISGGRNPAGQSSNASGARADKLDPGNDLAPQG